MAQQGNVFLIRTDPAVHFTGALAQNAGASENLALPEAIAAGRTCRSRVKSITILSVQNLDWELWLYSNKDFRTGAVATERFRGRWGFVAADGLQVAATGLYAYYIDGNDIPYEDDNRLGQLHLLLVNRNAVAKIAGAAGAIRIDMALEPTLGW